MHVLSIRIREADYHLPVAKPFWAHNTKYRQVRWIYHTDEIEIQFESDIPFSILFMANSPDLSQKYERLYDSIAVDVK